VEELWSRVRALWRKKDIGKPRLNVSVSFSAHSSARDLSPSGGASIRSRSSSS
jgi:hypothetical protein